MKNLGRATLAFFFLGTLAAAEPELPAFAGVDANYSLGMEKDGQKWRWSGLDDDLFRGIARQGVQGFRVRLWTKDDGQNGKAYATQVMQRALAAGLQPYLVIFLSEDWADLMKQPAPAPWKDLDLASRAAAVRDYSRNIVTHFRKQGLKSHLYEIGNEIDYGICGVYPGRSTKKSPASLSQRCWPQAAELIKASQQGVKEADPEAKFLLHIAHWWDVKFCIAFFQFMLAHDISVDFAGLSYFPSSNIGGSLEMEQFGQVAAELNAAIHRPIIVPETGYPSTSDFKGQFSRWKKETPGYPLTPEGQRRWVSDFLDFCAAHPAIAAVYYWSPEWCGDGMWKAFALFDVQGDSKPAWSAFSQPRKARPKPKVPIWLEMRGGSLYLVPVGEARRKAAAILENKLKRFGRVNVDYIKDITATELIVSGYQVALRASLSGNLDLAWKSEANATRDGRTLLEKLDPATQRVVIFTTEPATAGPLLAEAKKLHVDAVVHPTVADKPLKFGLDTAGAVESK